MALQYAGLARSKSLKPNPFRGKFQGVTSTITLMELTVLPWRMGYENVAREYEAVLVNFPNLSILEINRDVARLAAKLRADYKISPADALQVAASLHGGSKAFLTNDKKLSELQGIIKILLLDDFANLE